MAIYEYSHTEWSTTKKNSDSGKVATVGSFPRNWLDAQNAATLKAWGITKTRVEEPTPSEKLVQHKTRAKLNVDSWAEEVVSVERKITTINNSAETLEEAKTRLKNSIDSARNEQAVDSIMENL